MPWRAFQGRRRAPGAGRPPRARAARAHQASRLTGPVRSRRRPETRSKVMPTARFSSSTVKRTAATSSRGIRPRSRCSPTRTRPVPGSSVSPPGRTIVKSRAAAAQLLVGLGLRAQVDREDVVAARRVAGAHRADHHVAPRPGLHELRRARRSPSSTCARPPLPAPAPRRERRPHLRRARPSRRPRGRARGGSAPIARRSSACSGLRMMPTASWPSAASRSSSLMPIFPCPPATTTRTTPG